MRKLSLVLLALMLGGCSAKEQIYSTAESVRQDAAEITTLSLDILEVTTQPEVVALATKIKQKAETIQDKTEVIKEATNDVTDIIPWWAQLLKLGALVAALACAAYFTWVYVVPIRMFVGRWLPARRRAASMLRKVGRGTIQSEEYIANWRADPANEAAYRAERRKEKLNAE